MCPPAGLRPRGTCAAATALGGVCGKWCGELTLAPGHASLYCTPPVVPVDPSAVGLSGGCIKLHTGGGRKVSLAAVNRRTLVWIRKGNLPSGTYYDYIRLTRIRYHFSVSFSKLVVFRWNRCLLLPTLRTGDNQIVATPPYRSLVKTSNPPPRRRAQAITGVIRVRFSQSNEVQPLTHINTFSDDAVL